MIRSRLVQAPLMTCLVLVIALAGCAPAASTPAPAAPAPTTAPAAQPTMAPMTAAQPAALPKIRMGTVGIDLADVPLFKWADNMKAQGVAEIEFVDFESTTLAAQATVSGAVDFSTIAMLTTIQLTQQGDTGLTAVMARHPAPTYILLSVTSVENPKALEGRKVGISAPGDVSDTLARITLKRADVDVDKVQFVRVGGTSARVAALQNNSIDAGMAHAYEAYNAMSQSPNIHGLVTVGDIVTDFVQQSVTTRKDYIAQNRDLVQKLVDGLIEADMWAATNKADFIALAKERLEGSPDEANLGKAYDAFVKVKLFDPVLASSSNAIQNTIALQQESGALTGTVPETSQWFDPSFVEDYTKRKGSS